jgi:hypothetical protein
VCGGGDADGGGESRGSRKAKHRIRARDSRLPRVIFEGACPVQVKPENCSPSFPRQGQSASLSSRFESNPRPFPSRLALSEREKGGEIEA